MNLQAIKVVAEKEFRDGLRDRRSLRTLLGPLLFGPLIVTFMFHQTTGLKQAAEHVRIPVVGAEFAPHLVEWLRQQSGVDVTALQADAELTVRNGSEDVVLSIDREFSTDFGESRPALVQILSDSTATAAQPVVTRLSSLLAAYNAEIGAFRLITRGINPAVAVPLKVEAATISSAQHPATILQVILMFVVVTVLTAGLQIASDSTAGERERGSLEALLLNPVPRWQLITGKWLAASMMAFAAMILNLLLMKLLLARLPVEQLGGRFRFGNLQILLLVATMGPIAMLGPAIQTYLSCSAKSFKEAQSYSVFLVLPLIFIGIIAMFYPIKRLPWLAAVPFLSQYSLGADILSGVAPPPIILAFVAAEAISIGAVFLWLASRRFASEQIIFARA